MTDIYIPAAGDVLQLQHSRTGEWLSEYVLVLTDAFEVRERLAPNLDNPPYFELRAWLIKPARHLGGLAPEQLLMLGHDEFRVIVAGETVLRNSHPDWADFEVGVFVGVSQDGDGHFVLRAVDGTDEEFVLPADEVVVVEDESVMSR